MVLPASTCRSSVDVEGAPLSCTWSSRNLRAGSPIVAMIQGSVLPGRGTSKFTSWSIGFSAPFTSTCLEKTHFTFPSRIESPPCLFQRLPRLSFFQCNLAKLRPWPTPTQPYQCLPCEVKRGWEYVFQQADHIHLRLLSRPGDPHLAQLICQFSYSSHSAVQDDTLFVN